MYWLTYTHRLLLISISYVSKQWDFGAVYQNAPMGRSGAKFLRQDTE